MSLKMTFCGKMLKVKMMRMIMKKKIIVRKKVRMRTLEKNLNIQRML
jgi:hypothetical protein